MSPAGVITMFLLQPGPHRFGYISPVFLPLSISSYQSQTTNYTALSYANVPDTKMHIPHNIPGIFLQTFVVLSHPFHILHQEDNTVRYWSDRTEYAGCFSQVESAVHNRRIPIQSVGFHILFPENYGKIQHSGCFFQSSVRKARKCHYTTENGRSKEKLHNER